MEELIAKGHSKANAARFTLDRDLGVSKGADRKTYYDELKRRKSCDDPATLTDLSRHIASRRILSEATAMQSTYITDIQTARRFGVHRTTPWRWVKSDPPFPRPVILSPGCTRWKLAEIEAWVSQRKQVKAD